MPEKKMSLRSSPELALIQKLGLQISSELELNKLLQLIVKGIKETLNYSYCAILIKEGRDLTIRAITDLPEEIIGKRIPMGQGVTGRSALLQKVLWIKDTSKCDFFVRFSEENFRSELAIPIIYQGTVLGVLNIQNVEKDTFCKKDIRILQILSNQLASAIRNAQIHRQLEVVQRVGMQLVSLMSLKELLSKIIQELRNTFLYDSCAIFLVENGNIVVSVVTGIPDQILGLRIPIGQGITGKCAESKEPISVGDISLCEHYIPSGLEGVKSEIAIPILYGHELLGVLTIESTMKNAFDENDLRLLSILSSQLAVAVHNIKLYAEIEKLAITDPLTGLYNYRYFYQSFAREIARSERYEHPLSLLLFDVDDFKLINDTYGHLKGDEVLKSMARLILKNIRRGRDTAGRQGIVDIDIAARWGGDELAILLPETQSKGAIIAGERLRKLIEDNLAEMANLMKTDASSLRLTASVGVTSYRNKEGLEEFLKRADKALYKAKEQGKNRVCSLI